jgi:NAD(P)-dependent dehydrogenase (short-subunit alcohol dehydrogenase family)
MNHVADCLAKALAPEIKINTVAPGFIDQTRWNEGVDGLDELRAKAVANTPVGRIGIPSDISEAVLFFAGGSDFVTGGLLVVDGGRQFYQ